MTKLLSKLHCWVCRLHKPREEFSRYSKYTNKRSSRCKKCDNKLRVRRGFKKYTGKFMYEYLRKRNGTKVKRVSKYIHINTYSPEKLKTPLKGESVELAKHYSSFQKTL